MLQALARPLLAGAFVGRGLSAWQHPGSRIPTATRAVEALAGPLGLPRDPELLVRANGAVMTGAGALLALGTLTRPAGAALAVTMLPGAVFGHPFWREHDPERRADERDRFLTDVTLVGAAALVALGGASGRRRS